jgi:hypothetical protein
MKLVIRYSPGATNPCNHNHPGIGRGVAEYSVHLGITYTNCSCSPSMDTNTGHPGSLCIPGLAVSPF